MRRPFAIFTSLSLLALGCDQTVKLPSVTSGSSGGTTGSKDLLPRGAHCTFNQACASGVCGVGGSGNCCAQACATSDPICGAIACDGTGACAYPNDAISCPVSCSGSTVQQGTCNGEGACAPMGMGSAPCPNSFACGSDGGGCNTTCTASAECAAGFVCNAGACVAPAALGPCTENDDCTSELCGTGSERDGGPAHCCSAACAFTTPPCGATDCAADSGACVYPNPGTLCGPEQSCDAGVQTNAAHCDGTGTCNPAPDPVDCAPYACGANAACQQGCDEDGGCAPGGSCDLAHHLCCAAGLHVGGSIAVDGITGDDHAICCGTAGNQPCQTITHVMQVIDAEQLRDVTIYATLDGGAGDGGAEPWPIPPTETYPIVLGWGAELNAPGIVFGDYLLNLGIIFTIGPVSSSDTIGYASMVGTANSPEIGDTHYRSDSALTIDQPTDLTDIEIQAGTTLYLANANILGGDGFTGSAIDVAAGAGLVVGEDKSAVITGLVNIEYAYTGIECEGGDLGCTISDVPLPKGVSSLILWSGFDVGISAGDNALISLKSVPIIGQPLSLFSSPGFLQCPGFENGYNPTSQGVVLTGKASMTFENGTVDCLLNEGFYLQASLKGVPSLTLSNTTIENTGLAVYASAGAVAISSSTIEYNGGGVEQDTDGTNIATIDLSGGAEGGVNVVACSNAIEGPMATGVSVLNTTSRPLNASNMSWDTSGPDVFECDAQLGSCTCEISSCTDAPGANGMDAVYESNGIITTTGNQLSTLDCTPPQISCTPQMGCDYSWLVCCSRDGGADECVASCSG